MDQIVVDAGVAVKWFVAESLSVEALRLLGGWTSRDKRFLVRGVTKAKLGRRVAALTKEQ